MGQDSTAVLVSSQNPDGGWPYQVGSSWTEPTVLALLALQAADAGLAARRRGLQWLRRAQRSDGGWPPQPSVGHSTWVTALVLLLPPEGLDPGSRARAGSWLLAGAGEEATFLYRLRQRMLGHKPAEDQVAGGWPWFPGTAAWVGPTAMSILALESMERAGPTRGMPERLKEARRFLLIRRCADGGWNHGSARALGFEGNSYPETTGQALLALHALRSPELEPALWRAQQFLPECRSAQAAAWLRLGLLAHGRAAGSAPAPRCRNLHDSALALLADCAAAGRNPFLG
jgi:hypothetical protein